MGLMQGLVSTKPVGTIAAEALKEGLIIITAGADVILSVIHIYMMWHPARIADILH